MTHPPWQRSIYTRRLSGPDPGLQPWSVLDGRRGKGVGVLDQRGDKMDGQDQSRLQEKAVLG